jgi:hypothetical protein
LRSISIDNVPFLRPCVTFRPPASLLKENRRGARRNPALIGGQFPSTGDALAAMVGASTQSHRWAAVGGVGRLTAIQDTLRACLSHFTVPDMSQIKDLRLPETPKVEKIHILFGWTQMDGNPDA